MHPKRIIKKVAVLGSGVMGSRIACHFANIGLEVFLLDILPLNFQDSPKELQENPAFRNSVAQNALDLAIKTNPSPLYDNKFRERISVGNLQDHFELLAQADWIIEAVIEVPKIKIELFEKIEKVRKKGTLITTNTSGIPMKVLVQGRSDDFQQNFCGTHFFNPPRYLPLLEIIPAPKTSQEVIDFCMQYGQLFLGKKTILCKDTPAFIANRIGVFAILSVLHAVENLQLDIATVDKLTGTLIGRPKSATFRTLDVVGLDTVIKVAHGLALSLPNDESKHVFQLPKALQFLQENNALGDKTGQGFYKKTKNSEGQTEILAIDFQDFTYKTQAKSKIPVLDLVKEQNDFALKIKTLLADQTVVGQFYRQTFYQLFAYCSFRIPEIADSIEAIDQAICAGFGWEYGPFKLWDMLGVQKTLTNMQALNIPTAQWVETMLADGQSHFYKTENQSLQVFNPISHSYSPQNLAKGQIILGQTCPKIWTNNGTSIYDLGDQVICLEFHTKMNAIGGQIIEGINYAITLAEKQYKALVIANHAPNFSAGANLGILFMYACEQEYDEIELIVRTFQQTMMRMRFSAVPVVVAPAGMALGGGCELCLHADKIVASAELYMGLVEVGVGLLPAGGGTKEMTMRTMDKVLSSDPILNRLQETFLTLGMGKVSSSAHQAQQMGFLSDADQIVLSRDLLIEKAKAEALLLADAGYTQPIMRKDILVQGRAGLPAFKAGVNAMRFGNYISDHDVKIADKIAHVMCGGDLSAPTLVSEQYLLDLEREAFLSLCAEPKTLERISSLLKSGKMLRN